MITSQSIRLAYWMDWDNSYHTMSDENNYTIWMFLKKCYDRDWIYEGRDVMPWCPRCGTGLSQHEIVTEGYKEIEHPGLYVRFPLVNREQESLLVWTTTPWTLTSNTAAAVNPELIYAKVSQGEEILYLSKDRMSSLNGDYKILEEIQGKQLLGFEYVGPFAELPVQKDVNPKVIAWKEVSNSEGTGIVHIAPGAGAEDFALSKDLENISVIAPLDEFGDFIGGFGWLTGRNVYEVNEDIYASLKQKNAFYRLEKYRHRYPVCWRCDSELVYRLVNEWFISMDQLREMIAEVARKIKWVPGFGLQRELDWLQNMDDWMISKKRYWGLALPIYKCKCGHFEVMGSEEELKSKATSGWDSFDGHSPHRPWIDAVKIACQKCGSEISRIADVGNPWLDAGIVSFSTIGYRHDRENWKKWFPADWITESFPGQFRNWFYSLLTMSTVLEEVTPTRVIHSYALMRDEKGEEMHKSKGNAIWFEDAADKMGADAMRWLYARHNPASNLNFGFGAADGVRRGLMIPLWNVYSFFITYANIDQYDPSVDKILSGKSLDFNSRPGLDQWIISELNILIAEVSSSIESFEPERAAVAVEEFVGYLSNWYVRRSRRRFWKTGLADGSDSYTDIDKLSAYATLYECLLTITKLLAPFMPFFTESMYQNLVGLKNVRQSVHLDDYPEVDETRINKKLSQSTRLAMRLSSLGRSARSKAGIKVRQPLEQVLVILKTVDEQELLPEVMTQIKDELNVKDVSLLEDSGSVIEFEIQPNLPLLGPKYGKEISKIRQQLKKLDSGKIHDLVNNGLGLQLADYFLEPNEVLVRSMDMEGYSVASEEGYIVAITTEVTEELRLEGFARELAHCVQNMRKSAGFDIQDRIIIIYDGAADLEEVIEAHGRYIMKETLSANLVQGPLNNDVYSESHKFGDHEVLIGIQKE